MSVNLTNSITAVETASNAAYSYILAYAVAIGICIAIAKTKVGYNALYYILCLALILLLVTQAPFIAQALKPITQYSPSTAALALGTPLAGTAS
jgi:ABC-type polysaccharide/polyol phosphate export permease